MTAKIEKLREALEMECTAVTSERARYGMILQLETYLAERGIKPSDQLIDEWHHALDSRLIATSLHRHWW